SIADVACGRLDGFCEDGLSLHDFGASALMGEEAGGIVTLFSGAKVVGKSDILAAIKALHPWLLGGFQIKSRA
ncbi:inositol monophosphatase, partial [Rhizobium ruizarguesonis]